jgi:hypothetical protein
MIIQPFMSATRSLGNHVTTALSPAINEPATPSPDYRTCRSDALPEAQAESGPSACQNILGYLSREQHQSLGWPFADVR